METAGRRFRGNKIPEPLLSPPTTLMFPTICVEGSGILFLSFLRTARNRSKLVNRGAKPVHTRDKKTRNLVVMVHG